LALNVIVTERGIPAYIRIDRGPEFISHALSNWAPEIGITVNFIDSDSPYANERCGG
jgi:putative transposase